MRKSFFPLSCSQSLCLHDSRFLVPLPIICQNLIWENTGFTKTRLHTSGISTPVSSIPTERAILGSDSFWNRLTSSSDLVISDVITCTSLLSFGYTFPNIFFICFACRWLAQKNIVLHGLPSSDL